MKRVVVLLPVQMARDAKVLAAQLGTSLSAMIREDLTARLEKQPKRGRV